MNPRYGTVTMPTWAKFLLAALALAALVALVNILGCAADTRRPPPSVPQGCCLVPLIQSSSVDAARISDRCGKCHDTKVWQDENGWHVIVIGKPHAPLAISHSTEAWLAKNLAGH
jgi:hypothetical protein